MTKRQVYIHQIQSAADKNLLPLAAGLVTSYAKSIPKISEAYNLDIRIKREDPIDTVKSYSSPDVLGFSTYSWNCQQSLEIARLTKLEDPNVLVVFGGPMVGLSQRPDELKTFFDDYPFADIVVHGMGEWCFAEILLAHQKGIGWDSIAGLSYRDIEKESGFASTAPAVFNRNLDELPSPFLDGTFQKVLSRDGDRITGALWETNRGCPFHCTFCVQGDRVFDKILMFDTQRLYDELEWMSQQHIEYIFATDANFGIKARDHDIARKIADLKLTTGFPQYFMVNWTKNSSTKVLSAAAALREGGIESRMTLARQSFSEDTLQAVKRKNIKLSTYDELKREAATNNVASYTELILGLPGDSYDSFVASLEKAMDPHLTHFFIVYLCRLLNGTEMATADARDHYNYETRVSRVGFGRSGHIGIGVEELEEIIVGSSTMPRRDWQKAHTFAHIVLALYNSRLAFYVLNFLRKEHDVRLGEFFEYLIGAVEKSSQYPTLKESILAIERCQDSILEHGATVTELGFTGEVSYEPQYAACLIYLNDLPSFYNELWLLVSAFLGAKGSNPDRSTLREVFRYQLALIPTWKHPLEESWSFDFNIPQYFQSLCLGENPIDVRKLKTLLRVKDDIGHIEGPVEFGQRRFTVAMFKIAQVASISTDGAVDHSGLEMASVYNNLEFI